MAILVNNNEQFSLIRNSIAKKGMTILKGHLKDVNRQKIVDITAILKKQQQKEKENKTKDI
jgi:hypothetical protein